MRTAIILCLCISISFWNHQVKAQSVCGVTSLMTSDWTSVGPNSFTNSTMGRATALSVDPNNTNDIVLGTRSSGIWKTTDGGSNWINITGFTNPGLGIDRIVRYNTTTDVLLATTQFNGSDVSLYSAGLFKSSDAGGSWSEVSSYPSEYELTGYPWLTALASSESDDLFYIGNKQKMFSISTGWSWLSKPGYPSEKVFLDFDDISTDASQNSHTISDIDLKPSDHDFIVVSPRNGTYTDYVYSKDGGETWSSFNIPVSPSIPSGYDGYEMEIKTHIMDDGDSYAILVYKYYSNTSSTTSYEAYIFTYDLDLPTPYSTGTYPLTSMDYKGVVTDFFVIDGDGSTVGDICIFSLSQRNVKRTELPFSPGSATVSAISSYGAEDPGTHIDVRSMEVIYNSSSNDYEAFIAHDGGISNCADIENAVGDDDWTNINGNGLHITEFRGFGVSEFENGRILATAIDGNGFLFKRSLTYPYEIEILEPFGGDNYRSEVSNHDRDIGVFAYNGTGTKSDASISSFNLSTVALLNDLSFEIPDGLTTPDKTKWEYNYALRPFDFDVYGSVWAGNLDIYEYEYDPLATHVISTNGDLRTETSIHWLSPPSPATKNPISAYKRVDDSNGSDVITWFATKKERLLGSPYADPVKIVSQAYDRDAQSISPADDITPTFDEDGNSSNGIRNQLDYSFVSCIETNDDDPEGLWVSFAGNTQGGHGQILENVLEDGDTARFGRIYYYDLATEEWENRSTGLPNYPVHCLEYWRGSDDVVFAGTDVGVFVWNASSSQWECFDTGDQLPYYSINKLEINYCTMKLYASAFGGGLWETDLPIGFPGSRPYTNAMVISSDVTWEQDFDARVDIVVKPGASLTIKNCEVRMPKDHRIVVERGAVLWLDNAVITNYCDQWVGVEVWGNESKPHPTSASSIIAGTYPSATDDQGVVVMLNGSVISNAKIGIGTYRNNGGVLGPGYNGGIVIAEDGNFLNNTVGVKFMPYDYPETIGGLDYENTDDDNVSYFEYCTFTTNDKIFGDGHQDYQVYMDDVDGVQFYGCTFENEIDETTLSNLGSGIYSADATYYVGAASCGTSCEDSSTFRGYFRAIEAANVASLPVLDITIKKSVFEENQRGILLSNVLHSSVIQNRFEVNNASSMQNYGLYLEDCEDYEVEENLFKGVGTGGESPLSAGIYVANNSNAVTEIYRNTFRYLESGIRSQTVNSKLQIKCNVFDTDIYVYNIAVTSGGIPNQGYCTGNVADPAGNVFSNDFIYEGDYKAQTGVATFKYRHHTDLDPMYYSSSLITLQDCNIYSTSGDACPTNFPSGGGGEESSSMMMSEAGSMDSEIDAIMSSLAGFGGMELGESEAYDTFMEELAYYQDKKETLLKDAYLSYVMEGKMDSAEQVLLNEAEVWAKTYLISHYINSGKFKSASEVIKSIETSDDQLIDFLNFSQLIIELKSTGQTLTSVTDDNLAQVEALSGKQSPAGVACENLLQSINGIDIPEVFDEITTFEEGRTSQAEAIESMVSIYPNPTDKQLFVSLNGVGEESDVYGIYTISTTNGKLSLSGMLKDQLSTLDVSMLSSGLYIITITLNSNGKIHSEKLVIE